MIAETAYTIEILLEPRRGARPGAFDVTLVDRGRHGFFEAGVADLDLAGQMVTLPGGSELDAGEIGARVRRGEPVSVEEGLALGRLLRSLLFADACLERAWSEIAARRSAAGHPLRLVLSAPEEWRPSEPDEPDTAVDTIPLELLADQEGFLFRDRGHVLIRAAKHHATGGHGRTGAAGTVAADSGGQPSAPAGEFAWAAPVYASALAGAEPSPPLEETVRVWSEEVAALVEAAGHARGAALLPAPSPLFMGREEAVERTLERLTEGRLVSIVGMLGIGKTEVAAAAARKALDHGALALSSVRWFSLDGLTEVDGLRARMALAYGLDPRRCKSDEDLAQVMGGDRMLVVLDGAEHLLRDLLTRTRLQWFLHTLLKECAELRLLVTARKRIGDIVVPSGEVAVAQETAVVLGPLSAPFDKAVFVAAAGARLSRESRISVELDELVAALMGHPRSLIVAAAEVGRELSLRDLRAAIERAEADAPQMLAVFGAEEGTEDEVRARRTLGCLNFSAGALRAESPRAAELLVWLGHLPGGFPELMLPHIVRPDVRRLWAALLRRRLVERRDVERRLRLVAPLGCFALQKDEFIAVPRQLELLRDTMSAIGAWLSTPADPPGRPAMGPGRDRALQQESNVAALVTMLPDEPEAEGAGAADVSSGATTDLLAKAVASAIVPFAQLMIRGGRVRVAWEICRDVVRHGVALGAGTPLAAILSSLGDLLVRIERLKDAEQAYEQVLPLYRLLGDQLSEASTLQAIGDVYLRTGRLKEAEQAHSHALSLFIALGDRLSETNSRRSLAEVLLRTDRLKEAEEAYEHVLRMYQSLAERLGEASSRQALGDVYLRTDRTREAEREYSLALSLYRAVDEVLGEANMLQALGDVFLQTDRLREAEEAYAQALPLYRAVEEQLGEANTLRSLGDLYLRLDRQREAEGVYKQALPLYRSREDKLGQANTLQSMGKLALARQDGETAFTLFLAALRMHEIANDRLGIGGDRGYLARAARVAGRPLRAAVLGGRALASLDRDDDRFGQMVALRDLARSLAALGEQDGAVAAWFLAWARAREIDVPSAPAISAMLVEVLPDFDAAAAPPAEALAHHEGQLAAALNACEARLAEAGEDPYSPLAPPLA